MNFVREWILKLPNGFVKDSAEILKPYCRKDNTLYGPFCMASDVRSAADLTQDKELLSQIPTAVHKIAQAISTQKSVNFYELLSTALSQNMKNRNRRVALLAAFLGLDDNAVQADRLKANLIFEKRFVEYARVFPSLTQYTTFPPQGGTDSTSDFLSLLYSTRTGVATLPGVNAGEPLTYKAYAGLYLGCRMAILGRSAALTEHEAFSMGYAYQLTKLGATAKRPPQEIIAASKELHAKGLASANKMRAGARFGYTVCAQNP
jgi:hypothetical protein